MLPPPVPGRKMLRSEEVSPSGELSFGGEKMTHRRGVSKGSRTVAKDSFSQPV
jgi:hypothetical protein